MFISSKMGKSMLHPSRSMSPRTERMQETLDRVGSPLIK